MGSPAYRAGDGRALTLRPFSEKTLTGRTKCLLLAFCLQKHLHWRWREQDIFLDDCRQSFDFLICEFQEETSAAFWEFTVVLLHEKNELRRFLVRHVNDIPHT